MMVLYGGKFTSVEASTSPALDRLSFNRDRLASLVIDWTSASSSHSQKSKFAIHSSHM